MKLPEDEALANIQKKELIKAKSSTESTEHSYNSIRSLYRLTPTGYSFYPIFPFI